MKEIDKSFFDLVAHPDMLYRANTNSVTFIYDPKKDTLYSAKYPTSHYYLVQETPDLKSFAHITSNTNRYLINAGLMVGRIGVKEGHHFITFWNTVFKDMGALAKCLNAIVKKYPEYGSPDTLVTTDRFIKYDTNMNTFFGYYLKDIPGVRTSSSKRTQPQTTQQEKPECAVTLDVKGTPTPLDVILGNFHMVKDDRLPAMKTAVCTQGVQMKDDLEKAGCTLQVSMLDQLIDKSGCNNQSGEYQNLLQGGRINRRQELQKIFADPERMEKEFRTQKELDAAWDELQGKREHRMIGFAEWLTRYS